MTRHRFLAAGTVLLAASTLAGQSPAPQTADPLTLPFKAQSTSSISYTGGKEGYREVAITNVAYDVTGDSVSGRPFGSRLVLRTTTDSKFTVGDEGTESTVTIEAWPLGSDLKQKPLYTLKAPGVGARTVDGSLWLVDRTLGEVFWWSAYRVGTGEHLFDTYVDLVRFTVSRADGSARYAGLEVPPDNAEDKRLKEPHVVAVLSFASDEKVIREVLITCADATRATLLRSYPDTTRTLKLVERPGGRDLRITFEDNYPSAPRTTVVSIPIVKDDLDAAHAQLPPGVRAANWRR